jgi:hypothetical protein
MNHLLTSWLVITAIAVYATVRALMTNRYSLRGGLVIQRAEQPFLYWFLVVFFASLSPALAFVCWVYAGHAIWSSPSSLT